MASMFIADQSALFSICFSARFRIKYVCYPLQSNDITCPTLRIAYPLSVLVHIRGNPRLLKVFSFKNNHWRNRASIGTNTFYDSYPFRSPRLCIVNFLLFCTADNIWILSSNTNIKSLILEFNAEMGHHPTRPYYKYSLLQFHAFQSLLCTA